jgi:hypothetical protein
MTGGLINVQMENLSMSRSLFRIAACLGLVTALTTTVGALSATAQEVEVKIVNITKGQVFSPVIAWSHSRSFIPFFDFGKPASDELRDIAENGDFGAMETFLTGDAEVRQIATTSPIPPGGEAVLTLDTAGGARQISLASMLVNTNDTFLALRGVGVPRLSGTFFSPGIDSGTEENNEDCAFIPGPACPEGSGNAEAPEGAEGYVFIQEGIHGVDDLVPAEQDWRTPVAYVEITRQK